MYQNLLSDIIASSATKKKINKDIFISECKEIMKFQNCKFLAFKDNDELDNTISRDEDDPLVVSMENEFKGFLHTCFSSAHIHITCHHMHED